MARIAGLHTILFESVGVGGLVLGMLAGSPAVAQMASPSAPSTASQVTQSQVRSGDATPGSTTAAAPTQLGTGNSEAAAASEPAPAEIVVTGTNLNSGFRAPTPVTVTTTEQLARTAPNNLADGLAKLPVFGGSISTNSPGPNATAGNSGQNLLNLRGLGDNRNLVLLDGRRVVATNTDFAVDINTLPQNLISRVDVVTGGASAAYGSDAVAGVVNFVLDTKFKGLKGEISGGTSTYGDLPGAHASLAWGGSFFGDRLHIVASTDNFYRKGLGATDKNPRTWYTSPAGIIPNVVSGSPSNLVIPDIRASNGTSGGLITSGILKGTQFGAGGATSTFNTGFDASTFQSGGDGYTPNYGFTPTQKRTANFAHATFDISNNVSAYLEGAYSYSHTLGKNNVQPMTGAYAFTIFAGNPYIPANIAARLAATTPATASFPLGRYLSEWPEFNIEVNSRVTREAAGFKGHNLFGMPNWNWEVSYSSGQTRQYLAENNIANLRKLYAAADAVVNPANGQIVCRSTLAGLDPGCVPLNVLGTGTASQAAMNYINGTSEKTLLLHQNVATAKLAGDFGPSFQLGAGPISFATGFEYRRDTANQSADAISGQIIDFTGIRGGPASLSGKPGGWRFFDPLPFHGAQSVKEGFLEIGVPILKDKPLVNSLDADGAVRYTSYSLAGNVATWKGGLNYEPVSGLRFRGTVSRDVRAPNLLEIFNSASLNSQNVLYPSSTAGATTASTLITTGNPSLKPEKALTQTYGMVISPHGLPGFHASVDYYKIKMKGAISALTAQNVVDFCAAGQAFYCSMISFPGGGAVRVTTFPLNLSVLETEGLDFEVGYNMRAFGNPLSLRLLANHQIQNFSQAPNAAPLLVIGSATAPRWKGQFQAHYEVSNFTATVNEQFIGAVFMDPNKVEGVFTNNNHVPAVFYTDITVTYKLGLFHTHEELFVTVENLFNKWPPIDVIPPTSTSAPTNAAYDRIGRYITAGVRFKF